MAIDGKWEMTINSPMGAATGTLDLASNGDVLTGMQQGDQGSAPVENGKIDGNKLTWTAKITVPMAMTLAFTGTLDGDKLSGSVKAGMFGSFPFTANRIG